METTFVGQVVWVMFMADAQGPFPGIVVAGGASPLVSVLTSGQNNHLACTHWLAEDGTDSGWLAIPADGQITADLFA